MLIPPQNLYTEKIAIASNFEASSAKTFFCVRVPFRLSGTHQNVKY